jgi:hypothetical protein
VFKEADWTGPGRQLKQATNLDSGFRYADPE